MNYADTQISPVAPPAPASRGLTHRTLSGLFWMSLGTGSQALLQLLVLVFLARLLNPTDFGLVSAALVVVGFTSIFSQLGVGPAIVQRPQLEKRHLRTGFTLSSVLGAMMTGLIWLLARPTAVLFRMDDLAPIVRVLALVFAIQGVSVVAESLLQRELRFRLLAIIDVTAFAAGYGAVGVALAAAGLGVWALVCGQLAQSLIRTSILLLAEPHPKRMQLEREALGDLLYFGGGFTVARVGNYLAGQADNLVVGRWLGAGALGIYGRAYQLMAAPANFFGQILDKVLFPAMVKVQDSSEHLALAYRRGVAFLALLILPASLVLFILAPEVIRVVLGPAWGEVTAPFRIFAAGMLLRTSYKMSDSMARSTGAVYRRAWRQAIYALLVMLGAWAALPWGLPGVAVGVLVAITVNFLLMAHLSVSLAGVTWHELWDAHRPALALTAILGVETWGFSIILRWCGFGALPVLVTSSALGFITVGLLVRLVPHLVLGSDGTWMLQTLSTYIPRRYNPLVRLKLVIE